MRPHSISTTNEIFRCIQDLTLEYHNIEYPELRNYSINLRRFFANLGDARFDDYWRDKKWELRRIVFLLSAAPLDKKYLIKEISKLVRFLEDQIDGCDKLYPNLSGNFSKLVSIANSLLSTDLDTIMNTVGNIIGNSAGTIAVLIKDSKLIPIVEQNFKDPGHRNVEIVSINSLKNDMCFDNLIIVGPANPRWYPDFVFSSPRARIIHVIKYRWTKGTWRPSNAFPKPLKSADLPNIINEEDESEFIGELIDPEFILPTIDFSNIIRKAEQEFSVHDDETEYVDALVGYLENEQIVFLDSDDNSIVRIIDVHDETMPIKKIAVKELEPDMFLILRTSGGGDYIVPIANRIMGDLAESARSMQKEWKDRLRRLVRIKGMNWVLKGLRSYGCRIARSSNVRNWMSYRSIKTSEFSDFQAILKLVGLDDSSQEIWRQMELIHRAHIQAGFHLTKLLLNVVRTADFRDLIRLGTMTFKLPDRDAGRMTAFRIKSISSETVPIPSSKIGIPLNPDF
jgi:hypothetical protein